MTHLQLLFVAAAMFSTKMLAAQQFNKITTGDIVSTFSDSRSVNFVDVNDDGWEDVFISNGLSGGENNMLYLNNGDSTFSLSTNNPIGADMSSSVGATFGDVDNDGDLDAYVTNWYGQVNQFYTNDSTGVFTLETIVGNNGSFAETASWGDFNLDGFLDLFVTNSDGNKRNFLFQNMGDGSFSKADSGEWVTETDLSRCVNWVDVNDDGLPDLFITNENNAPNDLFINAGNGIFTKITTGTIVTTSRSSQTSSWADIDNDGDQDLFVGNAGFYQEQHNQLFINEGGNFTEVSNEPIVMDGGCTYGSNFGDYDNDGDLDLVVMNGFCNSNLSNYLYENQGDGTFVRRDSLLPNLSVVCSYGGAWGDINNDGFLDLVMANCKNKTVDPKPVNDLYLNNGNANNWLKIRLKGVMSNASAIGAKVRVKAIIQGVSTWQMREISAQSGYAGQNSLIAHFGLDASTDVDSIRIEWPSGEVTELQGISSNQLLTVIEGSPSTGFRDELPVRFGMKCFPNPTSNSIEIAIVGKENLTGETLNLRVMDMQGKLIVSKSYLFSSSSIILDFPESITSGLYHLTATVGGDSLTKKIVIE